MERATENVTEITGFDAGNVLDETEQVRPGRRHRAPEVVLGQAVELVQHAAELSDVGNLDGQIDRDLPVLVRSRMRKEDVDALVSK